MMKRTILFVDDDPDDREFMGILLKEISPSINAVFAENGLKALQYLNTTKQNNELPCLIVLDINMPLLDGKETYKRIRNELSLDDVPVIIFTSSHNPNDKTLFSNLGVEFITKPDEYGYYNQILNHMVNRCCTEG